jgi:HK97 family phage portal protein
MRLLGFELTRASAVAQRVQTAVAKAASASLRSISDARSWITLYTGQPSDWFQKDIHINPDRILAQSTVFSCMTLIASDIAKCCLKLVEKDTDGIWIEVDVPAFSPVIRKPNNYQTTQQFIECWILSKLKSGNTIALVERDKRGVVTAQHVLDWRRVLPLVSDDGRVYYQLQTDVLAGIAETFPAVPASEIMHDRWNCLFHPLIGMSPLFASGLAAEQALRMQSSSAKFFENMMRPSGVLTAPKSISDEVANRLQKHWEDNFTGNNIGKVAVLGDDLKYMPMAQNAEDSQMVEQLKLTAEQVASTFHVPAYMVGAAAAPTVTNAQVLTVQYFGQCLQTLMKAFEDVQDDGMRLASVVGHTYGVYLELDDLFRMDELTLSTVLKEQMQSGIRKPDEARRRLNLGKVAGGDTPYLQQQNFSLAALAKRDSSADPFGTAPKPAPAAPADPAADPGAPPPPSKDYNALRDRVERSESAMQEMLELVRQVKASSDAEMEARQEAARIERERLEKTAEADAASHALADALIARFAKADDEA